MSDLGICSLLVEGEKLVAALGLETTALTSELPRLGDEDVACFAERRQELISAVQKFDSNCARFIGRPAAADGQLPAALDEVRGRIATALHRTIEADRLLLALAVQEKSRIESELDAIALGRRALRGYATRERQVPLSMNRTA